MDGRSDHPTHVVARERIERQLHTWHAEHPDWHVECNVPLKYDPDAVRNEADDLPFLIMTFYVGADHVGWYTRYPLSSALMIHLANHSIGHVGHTINVILLHMQSEIGRLRRGSNPAT